MEEAIWVNTRAMEDTAKARGLTANDSGWTARETQLESTLRAQVYQVIACCRQGPEADSPKFFEQRHSETLRREPGYVNAVQDIVALSDRLAVGQGEAAALKEAMCRFFAWVGENWAPTWCSLLTTDCSPAVMEAFLGNLEDYARSACALSQPTGLSAGSLWVMTQVLQVPSQNSAPPVVNEPA